MRKLLGVVQWDIEDENWAAEGRGKMLVKREGRSEIGEAKRWGWKGVIKEIE